MSPKYLLLKNQNMKKLIGTFVLLSLTDVQRQKLGGNHLDTEEKEGAKTAAALVVSENKDTVNIRVFGDSECEPWFVEGVKQGTNPGQWQAIVEVDEENTRVATKGDK